MAKLHFQQLILMVVNIVTNAVDWVELVLNPGYLMVVISWPTHSHTHTHTHTHTHNHVKITTHAETPWPILQKDCFNHCRQSATLIISESKKKWHFINDFSRIAEHTLLIEAECEKMAWRVSNWNSLKWIWSLLW